MNTLQPSFEESCWKGNNVINYTRCPKLTLTISDAWNSYLKKLISTIKVLSRTENQSKIILEGYITRKALHMEKMVHYTI